jgi:hypothetical protein
MRDRNESKSKEKERWRDDNGTLLKEKDDSNFLGFCLLGMNGKKIRVSKKGVPCKIVYSLSGFIFLALLKNDY